MGPEQVETIAASVPEVQSVDRLRLPWLGHALEASMAITVDCDMTVPCGHRFSEEVRHRLLHEVRRLDNAPLRNVPAALRAEVATFASPLGLALREVSPNDALGVNFRQGEFAYHRGQDELRRALWRTAVVAALVITLVIANT